MTPDSNTVVPAPTVPPVRKLGRVKPKQNYVHGQFRVVVDSKGKTHYYPRLLAHYDRALDVVPPPAGPLGRKDKAAAAIARMYLNDQYGDCVIASRYHAIGVWSGNDGTAPLLAQDQEVYQTYQSACGPGDNGCDMSQVNQYQQTRGVPVNGTIHKIDGAVSVDNANKTLVQVAIDVFGSLNVGMNLPNDWYQSAEGSDWGPTNSNIVGGHEVQAYDYDAQGVWIATWGGTRRILWAAFCSTTWIDELYVALSPDWYGADNLAPNGINAADLKADLALVANGQVPPLPGPTPVQPTPTPPVPVPPVPSTQTFTLNGTLSKSFWSSTGTFTGTAIPTPTHFHANQSSKSIAWLSLISDVFSLIGDVKNKNYNAVVADVEAVLTDLGITIPPLFKPTLTDKVAKAAIGAVDVNWGNLLTDTAALLKAVFSFNVTAIQAAVTALLADLGYTTSV